MSSDRAGCSLSHRCRCQQHRWRDRKFPNARHWARSSCHRHQAYRRVKRIVRQVDPRCRSRAYHWNQRNRIALQRRVASRVIRAKGIAAWIVVDLVGSCSVPRGKVTAKAAKVTRNRRSQRHLRSGSISCPMIGVSGSMDPRSLFHQLYVPVAPFTIDRNEISAGGQRSQRDLVTLFTNGSRSVVDHDQFPAKYVSKYDAQVF